MRTATPLEDRFWPRVSRGAAADCWPWTGGCDRKGYGRVREGRAGSRMQFAHRVAYALTHGSIPDGLGVLHTCDNPPCCNPAHLFAGTQADNNTDKAAKGRAVNTPAPGEANRSAKLTDDDVRAIRAWPRPARRADRGRLVDQLAAHYGVSRSAIFRVRSGAYWSHLD